MGRRIEWDIAGSDDKEETVVQRYNRLMCEVNSLQQDVLQHSDKVTSCVRLTMTRWQG